jgi:hypothetical protein
VTGVTPKLFRLPLLFSRMGTLEREMPTMSHPLATAHERRNEGLCSPPLQQSRANRICPCHGRTRRGACFSNIRRTFNMKASVVLVVSALATGLLGVGTASAAPASGAAISSTASADSLAQNVWYRPWGGRGWGWRGWGWRPWGWRPWGPAYYRPWWGPGWCHFHPYQCGRW